MMTMRRRMMRMMIYRALWVLTNLFDVYLSHSLCLCPSPCPSPFPCPCPSLCPCPCPSSPCQIVVSAVPQSRWQLRRLVRSFPLPATGEEEGRGGGQRRRAEEEGRVERGKAGQGRAGRRSTVCVYRWCREGVMCVRND